MFSVKIDPESILAILVCEARMESGWNDSPLETCAHIPMSIEM